MHTIASILFAVLALLFLLKILWNVAVPYQLAWEMHSQRKESASVTLLWYFDIILLILGSIAASLSQYGPAAGLVVAGAGLALIVASYLLFALGMVASGMFLRYIGGRKPPADDEPGNG